MRRMLIAIVFAVVGSGCFEGEQPPLSRFFWAGATPPCDVREIPPMTVLRHCGMAHQSGFTLWVTYDQGTCSDCANFVDLYFYDGQLATAGNVD